ncbi:superinfection immunity protein [Acidiphilium multivorum]|uniref:superinfection immunity protein n=1 Tax=Acidiphilium multivorum TaxID=62140 RepID=UPI001B8C3A7D|nr:superinfection immunity protein [Acidiphilium multivorum]MBS3025541.1 superinfection immunity protein [Acidiphilium multivorum]
MSGLLLIGVLVAYFLPTTVATMRRHRNGPAILILNLFLGWTFIGWVAALVWSATDATKSNRVMPPPEHLRDDLYIHPSLKD